MFFFLFCTDFQRDNDIQTRLSLFQILPSVAVGHDVVTFSYFLKDLPKERRGRPKVQRDFGSFNIIE